MLKLFKKKLRQLSSADFGNVAVIFALSALPLLLAVGSAIDYMDASKTRKHLVNAADAAALAGVKAATEYRIKNPDAGRTEWKKVGRKAARQFYQSNTTTRNDIKLAKPKISFRENGSNISSKVYFSGEMKTSFMRIIGKTSMDLSGVSHASAGLPSFAHINFLIDVSSSMGIGATKADQQVLLDNIGCTLACHFTDTWGNKNTLPAARATGATLRIDVVKSAVTNILASLKANQLNSQQFTVSIYTFSNSITELFGSSNDLDAAIVATKSIDLTGSYQQGGTNLQYSIKQLADVTKTGGDGTSANSPKTYTVLMTDGLENSITLIRNLSQPEPYITYVKDKNFMPFGDSIKNKTDEIIQGFDPNTCKLIKDKNQQLMAINVKYLVPSIAPDSSEFRYMFIDTELAPNIKSSMAKCVSNPEYAWNASSPDEIAAAADKILLAVQTSSVRLTQ